MAASSSSEETSTDLPSEGAEVGDETGDEVGLMQGAVTVDNPSGRGLTLDQVFRHNMNTEPGPSASSGQAVCTSPRAEARECVGATMCVSNTHKPYKEARCQTRGIGKGCVWRDGCCECIVGQYSRKSKDCLYRPVTTGEDHTSNAGDWEMVKLMRRQYPPLYPEPLEQLQRLFHQQQTAIEEGEPWEVVHDPSASSSCVEQGPFPGARPSVGSEKMAAEESHLTKPL